MADNPTHLPDGRINASSVFDDFRNVHWVGGIPYVAYEKSGFGGLAFYFDCTLDGKPYNGK